MNNKIQTSLEREIEAQEKKVKNCNIFIKRSVEYLKQQEIKLASLILGVDLIVGKKYYLQYNLNQKKIMEHTGVFKKIFVHKFNDGKPEDPLDCYWLYIYKPEKDVTLDFHLGGIDKIKLLS